MKFYIAKYFFKIILKINKKLYINKQLDWGKKNLNSSFLFLSFDFETQRDINIIEKLTKKLRKSKIYPYYAIPGELIFKNRKLIHNICNKCTFINHGYKIHTQFDIKRKKNKSIFSYVNLKNRQIIEDIKLGDETIKKYCKQVPKIFRVPHFGEYSEKCSLDLIHNYLSDLNYSISSSTTPIYSLIKSPIFKKKNILELPSSSYIENPSQIIDSWSILNSNLNFNHLSDEIKKMISLMKNSNIFFNIYFDPSDIIDNDDLFGDFLHISRFQRKIENFKILQ